MSTAAATVDRVLMDYNTDEITADEAAETLVRAGFTRSEIEGMVPDVYWPAITLAHKLP